MEVNRGRGKWTEGKRSEHRQREVNERRRQWREGEKSEQKKRKVNREREVNRKRGLLPHHRPYASKDMQDLSFSQRWWWQLKSYWIWHRVDW
jgi:hypothetical protein